VATNRSQRPAFNAVNQLCKKYEREREREREARPQMTFTVPKVSYFNQMYCELTSKIFQAFKGAAKIRAYPIYDLPV
jgi:hypothetical protein